MQLTCQDIKIVEKIVETREGLFLARFVVVNSAGNIKWKLIELVNLPAQEKCSQEEILLIEAPEIGEAYTELEPRFTKILSPFLDLFFFTSQPTRAPNF